LSDIATPWQIDSVAQRLWDALEPMARADAANGWGLLAYLDTIGQMFQPVADLAEDDVNGIPGWSRILDIDRADDDGLPWLSQLLGIQLVGGRTADQWRQDIRDRRNWERGTVRSFVDAARPYLTGSRTVIVRERDVTPYHVTVVTYAHETNEDTIYYSDILEDLATYTPLFINYSSYSDLYWGGGVVGNMVFGGTPTFDPVTSSVLVDSTGTDIVDGPGAVLEEDNGSVVIRFSLPYATSSVTNGYIWSWEKDRDNRIYLVKPDDYTGFKFLRVTAGVIEQVAIPVVAGANTHYTIGLQWTPTTIAMSISGAALVTVASLHTPMIGSNVAFRLGSRPDDNTQFANATFYWFVASKRIDMDFASMHAFGDTDPLPSNMPSNFSLLWPANDATTYGPVTGITASILRDLLKVKPAGLQLAYRAISAQDYYNLYADHNNYIDIMADFATYYDIYYFLTPGFTFNFTRLINEETYSALWADFQTEGDVYNEFTNY
jgi:hypothetical protein